MTSNSIRTVVLMTLVAVLFMFVGQILGGNGGMVIALLFAVGMNFFSYWYSDKMVLKMYRAQPVEKNDEPELYMMVRELADQANLPMPALYIIPQQQPNAFATGRNPDNAVVAVTKGILKILDKDELRGVIAHELAHIQNRDILTQTIVSTVVSAITMVSHMAFFLPFGGGDREGSPLGGILVLLLAPLAAGLLHSAISRTREFAADRDGAEIAQNPRGLANALKKIEQAAQQMPMKVKESTAQSTAHMFAVNPFSGGRRLMRLFSTHPPTEERIERLMEMDKSR